MKTLLRQSAKLNWVTPTDITGAAVHGYVVYLAKARDRSRWLRDFELPLEPERSGEEPSAQSEHGGFGRHTQKRSIIDCRLLKRA